MNQDVEESSDVSASSDSVMSTNLVLGVNNTQLCNLLKHELKTDQTKDSNQETDMMKDLRKNSGTEASETKKKYESGIQALGAISSRCISDTFSSVNNDIDYGVSKILLTEDDQFNIMALTGLLAQFNMTADIATDGVQAIKLVETRFESSLPMYDLILMDYSMAEMDGPTCVSKIRSFLSKN